VVGGDADPGLLEFAAVRRRGSLPSACDVVLLVDHLPQSAATESVPCTLVVDARYVERVTTCARFDLEVVRCFLSPRLDLDRPGRLSCVIVAGRSQVEWDGPAVRRVLH
jgi:hypothetical protein